MEDERIINLFFERSEEAIKALDEKYGRACYSVSYNILKSHPDAEECVNDTYLGVWNAIPPARPSPLIAYVLKITRNISLKRYEHETAEKRNGRANTSLEEIEDYLESPFSIEDELSRAELTQAIEDFLATLTRENRVIFLRRYWFFDNYAQISKKVGLTKGTISVRLTRIRKQLKIYLLERGIKL